MTALVLDIGNTAAKYGCFQDHLLVATGVVTTPAEWASLVLDKGAAQALVASVAAPADEWAAQATMPTVVFRPGSTPVPLHNAYATPQTLGADRLAAAVGAAYLLPGRNVLVVDAGTCLKCDLVTADGTYHGGSIAPGLRMRLQAMHAFTGRLPELPLPTGAAATADALPLMGTDTRSAMLSGALNGAAAELNGVVTEYRTQFPDLAVVLTGGDAAFFESRLKGRTFVVPELVLLGLHHILVHNAA
ncbi:type III pantothenate kinase [Hymenobacter busanensis]|uniref:Type III pantothenate kinase n=1 Tax=Hymenobacter busanensis TaxID=2607656 RepID=A0A7L4ZYQ5_9BACT|nr:type III pantothenate kinase [Hymenobacter busanensis]KAA9332935.1 type III pantothenate kinase [Hymenobacter busanensis]QHJ08391.1 type III pantothenate kinase [Hymenobacter busanensis]